MPRVILGDCLDELRKLPDDSVHCSVTSPPYWGLRDYGVEGQLGQEKTPEEFVEKLVTIFREVRRVLRGDGTLWLNLGDSYSAHAGKTHGYKDGRRNRAERKTAGVPDGIRAKNLIGVPWRVAFALQADGWYLRSDIIWHKTNSMPESVKDRPSRSHEYVFLLTKSDRYFYDFQAVREPISQKSLSVYTTPQKGDGSGSTGEKMNAWIESNGGRYYPDSRNKRTVWPIATRSYKGAHFATFPPKLIEPCILAGTSDHGCCAGCGSPWQSVYTKTRIATRPGANTKVSGDNQVEGNRDPLRHVTHYSLDRWEPTCKCKTADGHPLGCVPATVLDPFNGSGTTGAVAIQNGRDYIGIELNPEYIELTNQRLAEAAATSTVPARTRRPRYRPSTRQTLFEFA